MTLEMVNVKNFIGELNKKVEAGTLDRNEAKRLALIALKEVEPVAVEDQEEVDTEEEVTEEGGEPDIDVNVEKTVVAPPPPAAAPDADPKTAILHMLTGLEGQFENPYQAFKADVESVLRGTEGAGIPIEEFVVGAGDNSTKLLIEPNDQQSVRTTLTIKKSFVTNEMSLPVGAHQAAQASVGRACHIPLRRSLIGLSNDILERQDITIKKQTLATMLEDAQKTGDSKVVQILKSYAKTPAWAMATQTYLLGSDYSQDKSFNQVLGEVDYELS